MGVRQAVGGRILFFVGYVIIACYRLLERKSQLSTLLGASFKPGENFMPKIENQINDTDPGASKKLKKGRGNFGKIFIAIFITAGILYYLSSFAGDNETIGLLQFYVIPCLTVLALIITSLVAVMSDKSKRIEGEPTQFNVDQSISQPKAKSYKEAGDQESNKTTSDQYVQTTPQESNYNPLRLAVNSGFVGVILTVIVVMLINNGIIVKWKHLSSPEDSQIENVFVSGGGALLVKTNSGHYYSTSVDSVVECYSNCWDAIPAKDWSTWGANSINDQSCLAVILAKSPPVEQISREFVFKQCDSWDTDYTRVVILETGDLWFWHKSIVPLDSLFGIMFLISIFIAPTFALIGVTLYRFR